MSRVSRCHRLLVRACAAKLQAHPKSCAAGTGSLELGPASGVVEHMTDASRSRRGPKGQSKAQSALAKLAELKKGGRAARLADSSDEEDAPIYDVVDDADYADIVAGRRAVAGGLWGRLWPGCSLQQLGSGEAVSLTQQTDPWSLCRRLHRG